MLKRARSLPFLVSVLTISCAGGQSGTDQFEVERITPSGERDAGSGPNGSEEALPSGERDAGPGPNGSEEALPSEPLPAIEVLCDGSESIRFSALLGSSGGGGPVAFYNGFLPVRFLAIDGQCRYWVNDFTLAGLRSGELSSERAEQLSEELHFGRYGALSAYESPQCPDGGGVSVTDATGQLICRCGLCDNGGEPPEFSAAFAAAWELYMELGARDEWAWGPTSVLAIATDSPAQLEWTLDLDLADIAYDTAEQPFASDSGALIDTPEQMALLSQLREQSLAAGDERELLVRDASGRGYVLFVRDEPPPHVAAILEAEIHQ